MLLFPSDALFPFAIVIQSILNHNNGIVVRILYINQQLISFDTKIARRRFLYVFFYARVILNTIPWVTAMVTSSASRYAGSSKMVAYSAIRPNSGGMTRKPVYAKAI